MALESMELVESEYLWAEEEDLYQLEYPEFYPEEIETEILPEVVVDDEEEEHDFPMPTQRGSSKLARIEILINKKNYHQAHSREMRQPMTLSEIDRLIEKYDGWSTAEYYRRLRGNRDRGIKGERSARQPRYKSRKNRRQSIRNQEFFDTTQDAGLNGIDSFEWIELHMENFDSLDHHSHLPTILEMRWGYYEEADADKIYQSICFFAGIEPAADPDSDWEKDYVRWVNERIDEEMQAEVTAWLAQDYEQRRQTRILFLNSLLEIQIQSSPY